MTDQPDLPRQQPVTLDAHFVDATTVLQAQFLFTCAGSTGSSTD